MSNTIVHNMDLSASPELLNSSNLLNPPQLTEWYDELVSAHEGLRAYLDGKTRLFAFNGLPKLHLNDDDVLTKIALFGEVLRPRLDFRIGNISLLSLRANMPEAVTTLSGGQFHMLAMLENGNTPVRQQAIGVNEVHEGTPGYSIYKPLGRSHTKIYKMEEVVDGPNPRIRFIVMPHMN